MNNSKSTKSEHSECGSLQKRRPFISFGSGLVRLVLGVGALLTIVLCGFLIGGFLKFTDTVSTYEQQKTVKAKTDAIVVFTGGSSRIEEAIKLLGTDRSGRLLISGVNPKTSRQALLKRTGADAAVFDCCVDIDTRAVDTISNAEEARKWAKKHNFASLTIVTSTYHMPRSILETKRQLPNVKLVFYPVLTKKFNVKNWYKHRETLLLLISEYSKFIAAQVRPVIDRNTLHSLKADLLGN